MLGASLSGEDSGKAPPDRLAFKPYWGKPTVRNFRGGDGDVGIIRSPVRAIALPNLHARRWWRIARHPALNIALPPHELHRLGLPRLST